MKPFRTRRTVRVVLMLASVLLTARAGRAADIMTAPPPAGLDIVTVQFLEATSGLVDDLQQAMGASLDDGPFYFFGNLKYACANLVTLKGQLVSLGATGNPSVNVAIRETACHAIDRINTANGYLANLVERCTPEQTKVLKDLQLVQKWEKILTMSNRMKIMLEPKWRQFFEAGPR